MVTGLFCAAAFNAFLDVGLVASDGTVSMLLIAIAFLFGPGPTVCIFSIISESMPARSRARLAGVNTMANALICNTLASYLVGALSDHVFRGGAGIDYALITVDLLCLLAGTITVASGFGAYRRLLVASSESISGSVATAAAPAI